MRVLFLHPKDDPAAELWAGQPWDVVLDLGTSTPTSYRRWSELFRCTVQPLRKPGAADFGEIRALLSSGLGLVVDRYGLDWWDLFSLHVYQAFEEASRLREVTTILSPQDQVFITHTGLEAELLQLLLGRPVQALSRGTTGLKKLRHYRAEIEKFSFRQLLQILGDKYDTGYQLRRFISPRRKCYSRPVVLLPSAYVNVSRTGLQYAQLLPDSDFLLIATRQSGWIANPPSNVGVRTLASYASGIFNAEEYATLLERWRNLKDKLVQNALFSILDRCLAFDGFATFLRNGLMLRSAWLRVFEHEPVSAVLCADDANYATRIPLLMAVARGLPALSCHHGALDGRYRFRPKHDCLFLAKGRMERDYLLRVCGSSADAVEIASPRSHVTCNRSGKRNGQNIVLFSEPYEILGGRSLEFYRELLPPLADLAAKHGCELVLKLHPAESLSERTKFAHAVLSQQQWERLRIVQRPLSEELLDEAWFAVTVISTTAVDCALRGVPAFICSWLDYSNYGYADQLIRFGAAEKVACPEEISDIPRRLQNYSRAPMSDLCAQISRERLSQLLSGTQARVAAAV